MERKNREVNGTRCTNRNAVYIGLVLMLCLSTAGCGPWHWPRLGKAKAASGLQIAPRPIATP